METKNLKEKWLAHNVKMCERSNVEVTGEMITSLKLMADWWIAEIEKSNK